MYEVWVEAPDFKGLSRVKQHKLITQVRYTVHLEENMHITTIIYVNSLNTMAQENYKSV